VDGLSPRERAVLIVAALWQGGSIWKTKCIVVVVELYGRQLSTRNDGSTRRSDEHKKDSTNFYSSFRAYSGIIGDAGED
jgi:hypothetical protein